MVVRRMVPPVSSARPARRQPPPTGTEGGGRHGPFSSGVHSPMTVGGIQGEQWAILDALRRRWCMLLLSAQAGGGAGDDDVASRAVLQDQIDVEVTTTTAAPSTTTATRVPATTATTAAPTTTTTASLPTTAPPTTAPRHGPTGDDAAGHRPAADRWATAAAPGRPAAGLPPQPAGASTRARPTTTAPMVPATAPTTPAPSRSTAPTPSTSTGTATASAARTADHGTGSRIRTGASPLGASTVPRWPQNEQNLLPARGSYGAWTTDSNPRPQPWQGCALPTEPRPRPMTPARPPAGWSTGMPPSERPE